MNKFEITSDLKDWVKETKYENGLRVFKYNQQAFWNSMFSKLPLLRECRGLVLDVNDNIIAYPFTKVHNINENGVEEAREVHFKNKDYEFVEKINGFMLSVFKYNNEVMVSTTGTLDSMFCNIGNKWVDRYPKIKEYNFDNHTFIFEVKDNCDPHIITETEGLYLIGGRENKIGSDLISEDRLDEIAKQMGVKRPRHFIAKFDIIFAECNNPERFVKEGYMIRDIITGQTLGKLKGTYYKAIKYLGRLSEKKTEAMFADTSCMKVFGDFTYKLAQKVVAQFTHDQWKMMSANNRIFFLNRVANNISFKPITNGVMNIVRGAPGSGKTTFVQNMMAYTPKDKWVQCEADMFYYELFNKPAQFNSIILKTGHALCRDLIINSIIEGKPLIFVSNVSRELADCDEYSDIAKMFGYRVHEIIKENNHGNTSIHNVPDEKINSIQAGFEYRNSYATKKNKPAQSS
jgi:hypothetical protein